jgi:hypothetical protein
VERKEKEKEDLKGGLQCSKHLPMKTGCGDTGGEREQMSEH